MCITDRPENLTSSLRRGTLVHRGLVGEVFDDRDAFMLLSFVSKALPQILDVWLNVAFQRCLNKTENLSSHPLPLCI